MQRDIHCVIGSGPAGIACATGLLARGRQVLMLDAGLELEPERAALVATMAGQQPAEWSVAGLAQIKAGMDAGAGGVPLKLLFGSDFPYRDTQKWIPWSSQGAELKPSLALGGLSNVWGSAMLPYRDEDMAGWPVKNRELAEHYRAVARFTGLSAQVDDLAEWFPLPGEDFSVLRPSRQAEILLGNLQRRRTALRARGWRFGRSRVAVRVQAGERGAGCNYCGLCMYGCPYGAIYNSANTVRELQRNPLFTLRKGVVVTRVNDAPAGAAVEARDMVNGEALNLPVSRVYLAAGVMPTAQIVLRSRAAYDRSVILRDSQYFLFPLLLAKGAGRVAREPLYTLSQAFIELQRPEISPHTVHLQVYSYSDIIGQALRKTFGPLAGPLERVARGMEERMLVFQGYLHSDESRSIGMTLRREGDRDRLDLQVLPGPNPRPAIKRVLRELLRQTRALGGVALPPMLQIAGPGRGFHNGGSFPMRDTPGELETDRQGRLPGWQHIHLVDASVLPSIPATTITFSAMANAHRIGWESSA